VPKQRLHGGIMLVSARTRPEEQGSLHMNNDQSAQPADQENSMRFRATVLLGGKTATGIPVPDEVVAGLGSSKRPAFRITIAGHSYRSTVARMGQEFMLPLSAENRTSAGVAAGDEVDVDIELDTEPREVTVPPDFAAELDRNTDAKRFFDGLSYSQQRWHVMSIEGAKTAETRQRRIAKSIGMLREGRAR